MSDTAPYSRKLNDTPMGLDDAVYESLLYCGPTLLNSAKQFKNALNDLADPNSQPVIVVLNNCNDILVSYLRILIEAATPVSHEQFSDISQRVSAFLNGTLGIDDELAYTTSTLLVKGISCYLLRIGATNTKFKPSPYGTKKDSNHRAIFDGDSKRYLIIGFILILIIGIIVTTVVSQKTNDQKTVESISTIVERITLDKSRLELEEGNTVTLSTTVVSSAEVEISWHTSDESIVTVSQAGSITAESAGEAVITATAGNQSAICKVTVRKKHPEVKSISLDLDVLELNLGDSVTLIATVEPDSSGEITWTSNNESVVTVDQSGNVTAVGEGTASIYAAAGDKSSKCDVTVNNITNNLDNSSISHSRSVPVFTQAQASSEYRPSKNFTYVAENVLDGDVINHVWCEGADGDGIGEWVTIEAERPQNVQGLSIMNGWPATENNRYQKNNRVRDVIFSFSDGMKETATLDDTMGEWQTVHFVESHLTTYIQIEIASIYKGTECDDTIIAEVKAF